MVWSAQLIFSFHHKSKVQEYERLRLEIEDLYQEAGQQSVEQQEWQYEVMFMSEK